MLPERKERKIKFTNKILGIQIFHIFQKQNSRTGDNGTFPNVFQKIYFQLNLVPDQIIVKCKGK